jgi:hypothetical protein
MRRYREDELVRHESTLGQAMAGSICHYVAVLYSVILPAKT